MILRFQHWGYIDTWGFEFVLMFKWLLKGERRSKWMISIQLCSFLIQEVKPILFHMWKTRTWWKLFPCWVRVYPSKFFFGWYILLRVAPRRGQTRASRWLWQADGLNFDGAKEESDFSRCDIGNFNANNGNQYLNYEG